MRHSARRVAHLCAHCGTGFLADSSRVRRGKPMYCSRACYYLSLRGPRSVSCPGCGREFWKEHVDQRRGTAYCSLACYHAEHRRQNHHNWKGGHRRPGPEITAWRKAVLDRDGHACQHCGKQGDGLCAHHIKSWSRYPELRYEISNGMTLCSECHRTEHPELPANLFT